MLTNLRIVSGLPGGIFVNSLRIGVRSDQGILHGILQKAVESVDPLKIHEIRSRWLGEIALAGQPSTAVELTAEERSWLADHPTIRLGIDPFYPPFEFLDDNGNNAGIAADYVRIIEARLGVNLEVAPFGTWNDVLDAFRAGAVDLLPAVNSTPERRESMEFTEVYLDFPTVIMMRDDHPLITGLSDLKGRKIALVSGYATTEEVISSFPTVQRKLVNTPLEALLAVASGEADAAVVNLAIATFLIRDAGIANLSVAAPVDLDLPGLAFGVRPDWQMFTGILDKALASISTQDRAAIRADWVAIQFNTGIDLETIRNIGIPAAVAVILIFVIFRVLEPAAESGSRAPKRGRGAAAGRRSALSIDCCEYSGDRLPARFGAPRSSDLPLCFVWRSGPVRGPSRKRDGRRQRAVGNPDTYVGPQRYVAAKLARRFGSEAMRPSGRDRSRRVRGRPGDAGGLVGDGHGDHSRRFALKQPSYPGPRRRCVAADTSHYRCGAEDQQPAQVTIAPLRYSATTADGERQDAGWTPDRRMASPQIQGAGGLSLPNTTAC